MDVYNKGLVVKEAMYLCGVGSVGKIAKCAGVSRPTAKKYLEKMYEDGIVDKYLQQYRPAVDCTMYVWIDGEYRD